MASRCCVDVAFSTARLSLMLLHLPSTAFMDLAPGTSEGPVLNRNSGHAWQRRLVWEIDCVNLERLSIRSGLGKRVFDV